MDAVAQQTKQQTKWRTTSGAFAHNKILRPSPDDDEHEDDDDDNEDDDDHDDDDVEIVLVTSTIRLAQRICAHQLFRKSPVR